MNYGVEPDQKTQSEIQVVTVAEKPIFLETPIKGDPLIHNTPEEPVLVS